MVDLQSLPSKGQAKNRPAPAHSLNPDSTVPPSQVLTLARCVKALIEKGDRAAEKAEQFYRSAGIHIKEIKEQSDDWVTIVREQCGLGRSRAYELIAIADGRTTLEKVRDRSNRSSKISHDKKSAVQRTEPVPAPVTESPKRKAGSPRATGSAEYSPEERRARMAALDDHDTVEDTIDEVSKRVNCVAKTIRRHLDGLTHSDRDQFFATLRDMIDVVELALMADDEAAS